MFRLLPWRLEIKKAPKRLTLEDVIQVSTDCQLRMDAIEGLVDELRKGIQATQRKVYRDVAKDSDLEALVNQPGEEIMPAGNHNQVLRTGDVPPDNWR